MKYKKIFSLLFLVVIFSISLLMIFFKIVSNDTVNSSYFFEKPLLYIKTNILDVLGVEEYNDVYRAEDRLIKVVGPTNETVTLENENVIVEVSKKTKTPIYFSLIPTAEYVQQSKLNRRNLVWNQGNYIDEVYYNVIENVNIIDITDTLLNCEDNIYFKTEDRISCKGAYYIFQSVMKKLDRQVEDLQEYDIEYYINNYNGSLSDFFAVKDIYDTISFYRYPLFRRNISMSITDGNGKTSSYNDVYVKEKKGLASYMGGENPITVIKNDETLPNKLLVLSDNTFNVCAGFFVDYFSEITVINPTVTLKEQTKIDMDDYDCVLVLFSTNTFNECSVKNLLNVIE